ncbi:MAG: hypothetical protein ACSLE0_13105, partial [Chitinophagaceae bacterium]
MKKGIVFPWYIFLLPLFFILHVYNYYFGILDVLIGLRYLFIYLLLSISLFSVAFLLFKNSIKAGILTIMFLIFFFFFGPVHDFLKSLLLPSFLVSYTFILSLSAVAFIFLIVRLKKMEAPVKANRFFLYLTILFCILESGITLFYLFSNRIKKTDPAVNNPALNPSLIIKDQKQLPDIFFMVIDEYTSSKALKKYFNFDNSQIDLSLSDAGFFISKNSQSNYNATLLSIGSTFNLQYFNSNIEKAPYNTLKWL